MRLITCFFTLSYFCCLTFQQPQLVESPARYLLLASTVEGDIHLRLSTCSFTYLTTANLLLNASVSVLLQQVAGFSTKYLLLTCFLLQRRSWLEADCMLLCLFHYFYLSSRRPQLVESSTRSPLLARFHLWGIYWLEADGVFLCLSHHCQFTS